MIIQIPTCLTNLRVWQFTIRVVKDSIQGAIPSRACGHLEQQYKGLEIIIISLLHTIELHWRVDGSILYLKKCFEIMNIVEPSSDLDILEETHPEDSKDEHYEEEKKTNVEKSRKGHHQREQQSPDTLGSFDQP